MVTLPDSALRPAIEATSCRYVRPRSFGKYIWRQLASAQESITRGVKHVVY